MENNPDNLVEPDNGAADNVQEGSKQIGIEETIQHRVLVDPNPDIYIVLDAKTVEEDTNHPISFHKVRTDPYPTHQVNFVDPIAVLDIEIVGMVAVKINVDMVDMDVDANVAIDLLEDHVELHSKEKEGNQNNP